MQERAKNEIRNGIETKVKAFKDKYLLVYFFLWVLYGLQLLFKVLTDDFLKSRWNLLITAITDVFSWDTNEIIAIAFLVALVIAGLVWGYIFRFRDEITIFSVFLSLSVIVWFGEGIVSQGISLLAVFWISQWIYIIIRDLVSQDSKLRELKDIFDGRYDH